MTNRDARESARKLGIKLAIARFPEFRVNECPTLIDSEDNLIFLHNHPRPADDAPYSELEAWDEVALAFRGAYVGAFIDRYENRRKGPRR